MAGKVGSLMPATVPRTTKPGRWFAALIEAAIVTLRTSQELSRVKHLNGLEMPRVVGRIGATAKPPALHPHLLPHSFVSA